MSLDSVRDELARLAPELAIIDDGLSTATVLEAAEVHKVAPDQIAKTLCVDTGGRIVLVVMAGTARLDNRRAREALGGKPRFLGPEAVLEVTSHPVGGVCPFGLPAPLPVYCDESLLQFEEIIPAAGSITASVRMTPLKLAELTKGVWVHVRQDEK
ncbi:MULTISPECIES: YbaK/EbsC family protein [Asaia]|uniref:YbaK/EbsC family protein n=1 Tax=Asaia spathodeae TaxID=657016 RepID=A0ABX2P2H5_9PROT|nr:YbaK/EbsC family protein [Asaia spathodeae]GBR16324.1 hypothetical protein AA105894_1548 [Asaia spathodeae NBRC 105894]